MKRVYVPGWEPRWTVHPQRVSNLTDPTKNCRPLRTVPDPPLCRLLVEFVLQRDACSQAERKIYSYTKENDNIEEEDKRKEILRPKYPDSSSADTYKNRNNRDILAPTLPPPSCSPYCRHHCLHSARPASPLHRPITQFQHCLTLNYVYASRTTILMSLAGLGALRSPGDCGGRVRQMGCRTPLVTGGLWWRGLVLLLVLMEGLPPLPWGSWCGESSVSA